VKLQFALAATVGVLGLAETANAFTKAPLAHIAAQFFVLNCSIGFIL
jgi:hypothetical protein